ncbi:MAG: single-stranded DNA-binding protein [archaeon ADurb.Bin336]|nr:MAG: single-stranded DNA-binding protein [archaeon ADurb.Bin336]
MKIKDLKPNTTFDEIIVEVVTKGEPRAFASASGQGVVCNAAVKDEDGEEVSLTLWNDDHKKVNDGDKVKITNGWVSEYKGRIQISSGRKGTLEVIE